MNNSRFTKFEDEHICAIDEVPARRKQPRRRRWLKEEGYKTVWLTDRKILVLAPDVKGMSDHYCTVRYNKHDQPYIVFGNTRYYVEKRRECDE